MASGKVQVEMDHEVRRERFGIEVGKMVASLRPKHGVELLLRASL